jgi:hypothetical protein
MGKEAYIEFKIVVNGEEAGSGKLPIYKDDKKSMEIIEKSLKPHIIVASTKLQD